MEMMEFLAIVGLQHFEPNQLMLSCGANCLEGAPGTEADRQELAKQVFSDMVLAAVQEPIEATHGDTGTAN